MLSKNPLSCVSQESETSLACREAGLTPTYVAKMLKELCNWKSLKIDKNGEVHEYIDGPLRLKAIDLIVKLSGEQKKKGPVHNHLHLENLPDDKLNDLDKGRKSPKDKK